MSPNNPNPDLDGKGTNDAITIRVGIDASFFSQEMGGTESFIRSLAKILDKAPAEFEFTWLIRRGSDLETTLKPRGRVVLVGSRLGTISRGFLARIPIIRDWAMCTYKTVKTLIESLGIRTRRRLGLDLDLMHIPFQDGSNFGLPYIYHPHDLQHLHLRENFTRAQVSWRERFWRQKATEAAAVAVGSEFVAADVASNWSIPADRIRVIKLFPFVKPDEKHDPDQRYRGVFPEVFYPAQFWPHKNHETLISAFQYVVKQSPTAKLYLTGGKSGRSKVEQTILSKGLVDNVKILGPVSVAELSRLYLHSDVVVVPSLFESASYPIYEAFAFGVPVAASDIPSLRAQAQGAASYFYAEDPKDMARAILECLDTEKTMARVEAGYKVLEEVTEESVLNKFLDLYREITLMRRTP